MRLILKCALAAVASLFLLNAASANWVTEMRAVGEVFKLIEQRYLWPIDLTACRYEILKDMTARKSEERGEGERSSVCLDKFSGFSTPDEARAMQESMSGHFGGVGIEIGTQQDGKVYVAVPRDNTPASRAGIHAGDILVSTRPNRNAAQTLITDANVAVKALRGEVNTPVYLTLDRGGTTFEVELIRAEIVISAVTKKEINGVGYVHVSQFTETASRDFIEAMESFRHLGPRPKVVFDLRDDPGGVVTGAIEILYSLSDRPTDIIMTTKYRQSEDVTTIANPGYRISGRPGAFKNYRIVVLINGGSASASEITSGTMKDWGYRIVADENSGGRSYGKGVGQSVVPLSDGSLMRLTTFEFLVGNRKSKVHEVGVTGDFVVRDARLPAHLQPKAIAELPELERAAAYREAVRLLKDNTSSERDAMFVKALELLSQ